MSTLKTHNLQSPDASSVNIALAPNAGMVVTGISTFSNDITFTGASYNVLWDKSSNALEFSDNAKATFGNGSDLQLYHNGGHNFIENTASGGNLYISNNATNNIYIRAGDGGSGTENSVSCIQNGAVELFHSGNKKFETSSSGVTVTGTVAATAYTGDGSQLSNLPASAPVGGSSSNKVFFENDKVVSVNYQITSTKNAMTAGPVSVNAGIAVTVPSGCSWTIV
tara:strand:+ start:397 stop:1068 length:672 start_codon:yes stop_codon:yes gene_type:complete